MLDDSRLRIFLSLAETGNFTQTAKAFGITQPAVSQNISDLEKHYGILLFERRRGAACLTPEGEVFRNFAKTITDSYDELEIVFSKFQELRSVRTISLTCDEASLPWTGMVLMPYIYKVCPSATVLLSRPSGAQADLNVSSDGGRRALEASDAFARTALCRLLRQKFA